MLSVWQNWDWFSGGTPGAPTITYPGQAYRTLPTPVWNDAYLKQVWRTLAGCLAGKLNVSLTLTLAVGVASSTFSDPRIGGTSAIFWMALTASAATEIGNGTIYVSSVGAQTVTIAHANSATADRTFRILMVG